MMKKVNGYSRAQIALHWMVVVLVAFQFVANDGIVASWRAFLRGQPLSADGDVLTTLHIVAGVLVLLLALARIYLRLARGAPPPPADEPRLLKFGGEAVHVSLYVLLLSLPVSGLTAWYLEVAPAGTVHSWMTNIMLGLIALHVAGALFQHLVRRSNVLIRMFRPESR